MYLIFQGIGSICKLPGMACQACGEVCKQMNCTACRDCCKAMSRGCSGFVEKPLSSFVVITCLMSICELVYLGKAFGANELTACKFPKEAWVEAIPWIMGQMAFAGLNLLFAPYFQYKVWEELWSESEAEEKLRSTPQVEVEKDVVQGSFKYVFMHDFGVCFYFFALILSVVWSSKGITWAKTDMTNCNPGGAVTFSANVGIAFFAVAVLYTLAWYCCSCCAKATTIRGNYEEAPQDDVQKPLA